MNKVYFYFEIYIKVSALEGPRQYTKEYSLTYAVCETGRLCILRLQMDIIIYSRLKILIYILIMAIGKDI